MFRHRPGFTADLLKDTFEYPLPDYQYVSLGSSDLPELRPTEYRADAVVVFAGADGPVLAVIIEVQRSRDEDKRFSWPVYIANLRARLRCHAVLLTVSTSSGVASWCGSPIWLGHPGLVLAPLALGPDHVPVITDVKEALRNPELTVLSALAHPAEVATLDALASALETFDRDHIELYADLVFAVLPAALRSQLEVTMTTHPYLSDFAGGYYLRGEAEGRALGEAEGRARGEAEGRVLGEAEGRARGELNAKRAAILAVLRARHISVSSDTESRITRCSDVDQLDSWVQRAATISAAVNLFD